MFRYEILRDQWIILALFGGTALVCYFILFYLDYKTPRKTKEKKHGPSRPDDKLAPGQNRPGTDMDTVAPENRYETEYMGAWQATPSGLKVTIALIVIYAITFSIHAIFNPYSW